MHEHAVGRHHSVKIAGSTLHYWVYGPSNGAPVIFAIHGFRGTHHGLEQIVNHLPDYTVVMPDLPGFGESTPMTEQSHDIDGYAAALTELIPKITRPDEPVYMLGHSFGSIVAAKIVADAALHFNGLILVNPIAKRPQIVGRIGSILYFGLGNSLSETRARNYFSWPVAINAMSLQMTKTRHKHTRAYVKDQHLTHFSKYGSRQTLRESFKASVTRTVGEYASKITLRTLLIAGTRDEIAPLKSQYVLQAKMAAPTELAILDHVGHLVHYEKAADTADFIKAFIED